MAAALSSVRGALAGLSAREKRLLLALGAVTLLLILGGIGWWSSRRLAAIEEERASMVEALRFLQRSRGRIAARNQRRDAILARYRTRAPALTTFVEEQAQAAHVQVAEAQDRPAAPAGSRFTQRSVVIRLRAVPLEALAEFMERIDRASFPVAITGVRVRRRFGEANRYDVDDMVISTFDPVAEPEGERSAGERPARSADRAREDAP